MDSTFLIGISLTVLITIAVSTALAKGQGDKIGQVRCRRCGYVGPVKGQFIPFRGNQLVCGKCGSLEWEKVSSGATSSAEQSASAPINIPPPPSGRIGLRIAHNGVDLGELPLHSVKTMLATGQLTADDYYFEEASCAWQPLGQYPFVNQQRV